MCGISGWYRRDGQPVDTAVIHRMCQTLRHRGPDDEGIGIDGDFGFGMRRLAVVDLIGGHQPMRTRDGRYSVVFNGEIYNVQPVRSALEALGHRFSSRCDTEVILEGYAAWGQDLWRQLEGMFAVAVWDHHERCLHLARDPLGIKPLYWTLQQGALAFGSELKALAPVPGLAFELDSEALEQYVTLGCVLAPRSIYAQVCKLAPGTVLSFPAAGPPVIQSYWRFALQAAEVPPVQDEAGWVAQCRSRLLQTVEQHRVADVPVGAFLSGGVDSAAVVAALTHLGASPVHTFTIAFRQAAFDESAIAREIAGHLGCIHREQVLDVMDVPPMLAQLAEVFDEPFADESAIPTWLVSKMARESVTVALSGDGGDELFFGYRRHWAEKRLQQLKQWPGVQTGLSLLAHLPALPGFLTTPGLQRLQKRLQDAALEQPERRMLARQYRGSAAQLDAVWGERMPRSGALGYARWAAALFSDVALPEDALLVQQYGDTTVWLPDDMLTKVDRASMAHSLEVRVPMLAHPFVEWAATVPQTLKLRGKTGKYILRQAIADWLPQGILDRPKQGFAVPIGEWLMTDFGEHAGSVWQSAGLEASGYFRPGIFRALLDEHRRHQADHARLLYTLLMLAYWWPGRLGQGG